VTDVRFALDAPVPEELEVGDGNVLLVRGWTAPPPGLRVPSLTVEIDGERRRMPHSRDVRWDVWQNGAGEIASGFWLAIPILRAQAGRTVRLRISLERSDGVSQPIVDCNVALVARREIADARLHAIRAPLAICLATYNPDLALFERQVESLRAQTVRDWTCIVQDDRSSPEVFAGIERVCARDPRFLVVRNARNLGFYHNFGRSLSNVPPTVHTVALCDQDDLWYPHKLEKSLALLTGDVQLVYSDMRLVDPRGNVISETYWSQRRNNYRSLATLMLANTVTGAASVFRRAVLDQALPFPPCVDSIFHDHWLAVVARLRGELAYVDEPLYDYTQHGRNVIGHSSYAHVSALEAIGDHAKKLVGLVARGERLKKLFEVMPLYYTEYRKLHLFRLVLALRFPELTTAQRRIVALFSDRLLDAPALMVPAHLGVMMRGDTTNMVEFNLGVALALHKTLAPLVPSLLRLRDHLRRKEP
jgi:glycosyltransferase involved in cell wall biosynthesis